MKENTLLEGNIFGPTAIKVEVESGTVSCYYLKKIVIRVSEITTIQLPSPASKLQINGLVLKDVTIEDLFKIVPEKDYIKYLNSITGRLWWFKKSKVTEIRYSSKYAFGIIVGGKEYPIASEEDCDKILEELGWKIKNPSNP